MKKASQKITALFEFNCYGSLTGIFLNSQDDVDQKILERGLSDLLKPQKFGWVKRLFWKR
jgi:hypothetical protein